MALLLRTHRLPGTGTRTVQPALVLAAVLVGLLSNRPAAAQPTSFVESSAWKVRFGAFELGPSFVMSAGNDSNVLRADSVASVSSSEYFTIPQIDLKYNLKHYELTGMAAIEGAYTPAERSEKKTNLNNLLEFGFASPETILRPRLVLSRLSTYARSETELGRKSQRNNTTMDAGLDWSPGRLVFRTSYVQVNTRYDADEVFRDVSLAEKLNFDFRLPGVGVGYQLTPVVELGARLDYGQYRFLLSPERNGDGSRVSGGLTLSAPGPLVGTVLVGRRTFQSQSEADVRISGLTTDAVVLYPRPTSRVTASFYRDFGFSWDSARALYLTNTLVLNYFHQLPRRIEVELEANLLWLDYIKRETFLEVPESQQRRTVLGAVGYRLTPFTRFGVNVERDESIGTENWDAWRITTYLRYGSNRFRKLDRPLPR
jgi:hypothetical protein